MKTVSHLFALILGASAFGMSGSLASIAVAQGHGDHGHHSHATPIGEPAKATASTRSVQIKLIDNAFEPETIRVKAGETVRFVITNAGQLLHEFNIGTAAMHAEHQKEMAMMAEHGMITATGIDTQRMQMDHSTVPGGHNMKHDDPNSVLVAPGEKKELVWKFTKAIDLEFACNVPGHYEAGMVGKLEFTR
jgi:uncharacterized cupredoxin-like copper-binding protein